MYNSVNGVNKGIKKVAFGRGSQPCNVFVFLRQFSGLLRTQFFKYIAYPSGLKFEHTGMLVFARDIRGTLFACKKIHLKKQKRHPRFQKISMSRLNFLLEKPVLFENEVWVGRHVRSTIIIV